MIPYFQGGYDEAKMYAPQSNQKIYFKCPDCGRIKNKKISPNQLYSNHSISCMCNSDGFSYPEKFMYSVLNQLNIDFETQYSPKWANGKRYDFYFELNNKKYIIEMDGEQHKKEKSENSCWRTSLEEQIKNDNYKNKLAEKYMIKVIRIDCSISDLEFVKNNILNSELNDIINLYNINWNNCEEFTLNNLCKQVCEIKRDNPNLTANEIGKIFKLTGTTIRKYLKKGSQIWEWCKYNAEEEKKRSNQSLYKNGKLVEAFKNNKSFGVFNSCAELERQSEELFGVKLFQSDISHVARGERKSHKGFTFRYIDDIKNNESA